MSDHHQSTIQTNPKNALHQRVPSQSRQSLALPVVALLLLASCASDGGKRETMASEDVPLPADKTLDTVMRSKTAWASSLLEAIAMRDYPRVETNAEALRTLSLDSGFLVQDTLSYRALAEEFRQEVTLLGSAAKRRDQADVETAYQRVTSACFRCHAYVGNERFQSSMPGRAGM